MERRIVWTPALSVGVDEIDRDHQRMFDLYEAVRCVMRGREDGRALACALDELVEYTRTHFAREERHMRWCDYPDLDAHVAEHRALLQAVTRLHKEPVAARPTLQALKTLRVLSHWIPRHIERTDLRLGEYLRGAGGGQL